MEESPVSHIPPERRANIECHDRFIEALKDVKTWIFFLFALVANLQGGAGLMYGIILKGYGFSTLQATLLTFPGGFVVCYFVNIHNHVP